jgi:hypothetical protein
MNVEDPYAPTTSVIGSTATPGHWTLVTATVLQQIATLQKQLAHVTSEMNFYRNGVVNWEAQALAWEATALKCQKNKGVC